MKRRLRFPLFGVWDVSVLFLILGMVLGTIAAVGFRGSWGSRYGWLEGLLSKVGQQKVLSRKTLFFQVWLHRAGTAGMLWLAGMTPIAMPAGWGYCFLLGAELALLLESFTRVCGIWGLPVFAVTVFPQAFLYIPVFWQLLLWAFAGKRRFRLAGSLILLALLGMGAAMEVWICPAAVSFLLSWLPLSSI